MCVTNNRFADKLSLSVGKVKIAFSRLFVFMTFLAQQFLYRRGEAQHPNLSSFMEEAQEYDDGDDEDGGEYLGAQADYQSPKLDGESQGVWHFGGLNWFCYGE